MRNVARPPLDSDRVCDVTSGRRLRPMSKWAENIEPRGPFGPSPYPPPPWAPAEKATITKGTLLWSQFHVRVSEFRRLWPRVKKERGERTTEGLLAIKSTWKAHFRVRLLAAKK